MTENPDLLACLDRLADTEALDQAIETTRKRLAVLTAIRASLSSPAPPPTPAPPAAVNGHAERPIRLVPPRRTTEQDDADRIALARTIAEQGPRNSGELKVLCHLGAATVLRLLDHPWFEKQGGKYELSNDGRQQVTPAPYERT